MTFSHFMLLFKAHFLRICEGSSALYDTDTDPDVLWELYLNSFPDGTNPIFRKRREHDCSCCRRFIRQFGSVVGIVGNEVVSIWDFQTDDPTFQPVVNALSAYVKSRPIRDLHVEFNSNVGTDYNMESIDGHIKKWEHFYLSLPKKYVFDRHSTEDRFKAFARDNHHVFSRSMEDYQIDVIDTVLELIASDSLYRGEEWRSSLIQLRKFKAEYDALSEIKRSAWLWSVSAKLDPAIARIRNHSIGTLLTDLANGIDLDTAVTRYEKIVAPINYKRPKAIFTQRMVQEAQQTITDLGYMRSLPRRHARLDDITVNNILFANRDAAKRMKATPDIFDKLTTKARTSKPMDFSRAEEISVKDFVDKVLPTAKVVEAFVENRHAPNLVSLIAPQNADAPSLFKWNNGFGWSYNGNIADSDIRENVKSAGGNVTGVLRFSIQWNDGAKNNTCDYDAHCYAPDFHIYFGSKHDRHGGSLDVDIQVPKEHQPAVENIVWPSRDGMVTGEYLFCVRNFAARRNDEGFRAELEVDGTIYSFDYARPLGQGRTIDVAAVTLGKNGEFSVCPRLPVGQQTNKEIWGLTTNQFVPVTTVMYSPNYWDDQHGIGHRHYFFMLDECVNPDSPNGFYNEFIKQELVEHKRVFEALGSQMRVEPTDDQLSGLGFSSTKRNDLVVRVTGATKRVLKIKF